MLILIDESGCAGFKQGSSTHFVLGMIIFDAFKDAEETANIIHKLKKDVGFKREFRFSSCDNRKRDMFFEAIKKGRFRIRMLVMEKKILHSEKLKSSHEHFINYCLKLLMKSGKESLVRATAKIDGTGSKQFKMACRTYLRREISREHVAEVKFCDSKKDVLIQLADMVVSAYARPFNNPGKADAFKWRNMIEGKIENIWNFR